jgi:hypothetical protein
MLPGAQFAAPMATPLIEAPPTHPELPSSSSAPITSASAPSASNRPTIRPAAPEHSLQVALHKFEPSTVHFAPSANELWWEALQAVVKDVKRVHSHPNRELLRGYALPDPHAFLGTTQRLDMYCACWLMIRPLWINLATHRRPGSAYPQPQDWKTFLTDLYLQMGLILPSSSHGAVSTSHKKSSTSGKRKDQQGQQNRSKRQKTGDDSEHEGVENAMFNVDISKFSSPSDVFWRDEMLITKDSLTSNRYSIVSSVAREIVWELFNTNFALELLATDRVIFPRNNTLYSALERDALVAECFPDCVLVGLDYPLADKGLGAFFWRDRIEYVEAFRSLLSTWQGPAAGQLGRMSALVANSSELHVLEVERLAYRFYCQTFFDYFG